MLAFLRDACPMSLRDACNYVVARRMHFRIVQYIGNTWLETHLHMNDHIYKYMHVYIITYIYIFLYQCIYKCIYMYLYVYRFTYTYIHTTQVPSTSLNEQFQRCNFNCFFSVRVRVRKFLLGKTHFPFDRIDISEEMDTSVFLERCWKSIEYCIFQLQILWSECVVLKMNVPCEMLQLSSNWLCHMRGVWVPWHSVAITRR